MRKVVLIVGLLGFSREVLADQFHYQNIIIGDRALGMGGAYSAVADDSSGVYYNPAGLGFALSNDVSGSANAFYKKKVTYKKILPGLNYEENSNGSVPSFFGGLQKLDKIAKGLVFAFGVYSTDSDLVDQDDKIADASKGLIFHRTAQVRGGDLNIAGGLGYRLSNSVSVGLSLTYATFNSLSQDFQYSGQFTSTVTKDSADTSCKKILVQTQIDKPTIGSMKCYQVLTQNIRTSLEGKALRPSLGVQVALLSKLSMGLTLTANKWISQGLVQNIDFRRDTSVALVDGVQDPNNSIPSDVVSESNNGSTTSVGYPVNITSRIDRSETKKPFGDSVQYSGRAGVAYFASPRLLLTGDTIYYGAVNDADVLDHNFKSVLNYAMGAEWYATPSFPIRLGLFTNNDNREKPSLSEKKYNDHIDYIGGSVFVAWVQPNSQIGVGAVYQSGTGTAAKTGASSSALNEVAASSITYAVSASHSF
jgi:long-chain fatty acid transport protein